MAVGSIGCHFVCSTKNVDNSRNKGIIVQMHCLIECRRHPETKTQLIIAQRPMRNLGLRTPESRPSLRLATARQSSSSNHRDSESSISPHLRFQRVETTTTFSTLAMCVDTASSARLCLQARDEAHGQQPRSSAR